LQVGGVADCCSLLRSKKRIGDKVPIHGVVDKLHGKASTY